MDRVGISFKSSLTGDEVRERYVRPLRAALEGAKLGFYSNYLRQGDNDTGPQEHLLVFQVFDFHAGLRLLRTELEKLERPDEVHLHNLNPSDPMY
ncbi:MAG: hypothetical protein KDA44_00050 [Planctomycetales bacterium]|nr:hypothetical protein [Planctomycetales bacterium]